MAESVAGTRMTFARYIKFVSKLDSVEVLPGHLINALKEGGIVARTDVVREDEGWGITFHHAGADFRFYSRFDVGSEPLECMGWLERQDNQAFFASKETHCYPELEPIIHAALNRLPDVQEIAWVSGDEM